MLRDSRFITLWTALLLLLGSVYALADEAGAPIPLAELGARADAQAPSAAPALSDGRVTLPAPLQALRGELDPAGLSVDSTSASEGGGRFRLTPVRLDKGGPAVELPAGRVSLRERTAVLERGPLTELLTASGDGLRQDFVVAQAPGGEGPLTLTLALTGASARTAGPDVALTLPGGRALIYHSLHITDAQGQVLTGTLAATNAGTLRITVADAGARYPVTIDPTISDADWQVWNPGIPGANQTIQAILHDATNSRLYVGGDFTAIGTVLANRIARWDGSAWSALGSGLGGQVRALALDSTNNRLYVGGAFTALQGGTAGTLNYIARWDTTQSDDSGWSALGSGLSSTVRALALDGTNNRLYVGGLFNALQGGTPNTLNYIAQWNTVGADDADNSRWSALGSGLENTVNALALSGTNLYVGGPFTALQGGVAGTLSRVARWDTTKSNDSGWSALASGATNGVNGEVWALAVDGTNLYVGGSFTSFAWSGTMRSVDHVAKWNGSSWSFFGRGITSNGVSGTVYALAVSGTTLYVGGDFTTAAGGDLVFAPKIAQWNGSNWSALGSGLGGNVRALALDGTTLYVGGEFTALSGGATNTLLRLARWNTAASDNNGWSALGSGLNNSVSALAVDGATLYLGGDFTTAPGGIAANRIVKWNGSAWSALGSGLNSSVTALALDGTNLYVGGPFTALQGGAANTLNRIARWDTTKSDNTGWSALGSGLGGSVNALALSGTHLYVGGGFTTAGGSTASRIAHWDTTKSDDSGWSALASGLNGNVFALAVSGSDLYVGGAFATAGGSTANRIAHWDTTKSDDSGWSALGSGLGGNVLALAVSGSDLYAGGDFTTAGGSTANRIARWDTTKSDNTGWSALGSGLGGTVYALALSRTNLYVGGGFTTAGGKFSPYAAYVNLPPCGFGIPLTTSPVALWQQLALPCVPSGATPSVTNVFGNSPTANLDDALYNVGSTGWILYRRDMTATPPAYVKLLADDPLSVGDGYWIKSYAAPVDDKLTVAGTATPTDATNLQGCAVAAGCKVVTLTTVDGQNRYNLVGNPFPFAIDWSQVRVRVTPSVGGYVVYTPCQAAGLGAGDGCSGTPAATPVISNVVNIWNGTTYVAFSDLAPTKGNLQYFKSFWVNVLPAAFGQTVELLIPAQATLTQVTPAATEALAGAELPWYLAWLDWVVAPVAAAPPAPARPAVSAHAHPQGLPNPADWYVRLKLDNRVTGWQDHGNLFGQITGAQPGYDGRDLQKMAPFDKPYLTVMFPHPEWGPKAGDYATDFRPALGKQPQDWTFEVRADPVGGVVFLSWEGDAKILKRSRLIDVQTGKTIKPADKKWAKKGYPITLSNPVQRYTWRYLGK